MGAKTPWQLPALGLAGFGLVVSLLGAAEMLQDGVPSCSHGRDPCIYLPHTTRYNTSVLMI